MKFPRKYFFLFLFPLVLALPLPLIVSSVALSLALLNVLLVSVVDGEWKKTTFKELVKAPLVLFGATVLLVDTVTLVLRSFSLELVFRDVRISFFVLPILFWPFRKQLLPLRKYILGSFVIGVLIYVFYSYGYLIYLYTHLISNRTFEFGHFLVYDLRENVPGAYHHAYIGMYMTFSISIVLSFIKKRKSNLYFGSALFILVNQVVFGSKLTIALSFILILSFFFKKIKSKSLPSIMAIVMFAFASSVALLTIRESDILETIRFSYSNRIESWQCTLKGFIDKPLFGHGHEASVVYIENCVDSDPISSHNQYLDEAINYGLFGLWLPFLFVYLFTRPREDGLLEPFVLLIVVVCFFESLFSLQRGVLFFVFFVTLLLYTTVVKLPEA